MMKSAFAGLFVAAVLLVGAALIAEPSPALTPEVQAKSERTAMQSPTAPHDFDFFLGNWRVHHRQLKERLAGSREWIEFEGTSTAQKILGGFGNMDDNVIEKPSGTYRAVTVRAFDPKANRWSIWWFDSRFLGHLDPPMVGSFESGVGTFYADDVFNGKLIRVRFIWSRTDTSEPRWEQAFSRDGGKTWETNWIMDFARI